MGASSVGILDFGLPRFLGCWENSFEMFLCDTGLGLTLLGFGGLPTGRLRGGGDSALGDECRLLFSWSKLLWLLSLSVFLPWFPASAFLQGFAVLF